MDNSYIQDMAKTACFPHQDSRDTGLGEFELISGSLDVSHISAIPTLASSPPSFFFLLWLIPFQQKIQPQYPPGWSSEHQSSALPLVLPRTSWPWPSPVAQPTEAQDPLLLPPKERKPQRCTIAFSLAQPVNKGDITWLEKKKDSLCIFFSCDFLIEVGSCTGI